MNWQHPFRLALDLALFAIGWTLVAIVAFFILAVLVTLAKGFVSLIQSKKPKLESESESSLDKVVRDFRLLNSKDKDK
mgnify:CR=1 FL=1